MTLKKCAEKVYCTLGRAAALLPRCHTPQSQTSSPQSPVSSPNHTLQMVAGNWTGTMCLTEPQCGSDLALVKTKAEPIGDGSKYSYSNSRLRFLLDCVVLGRVREDVSGRALFSQICTTRVPASGLFKTSLAAIVIRQRSIKTKAVDCITIEGTGHPGKETSDDAPKEKARLQTFARVAVPTERLLRFSPSDAGPLRTRLFARPQARAACLFLPASVPMWVSTSGQRRRNHTV